MQNSPPLPSPEAISDSAGSLDQAEQAGATLSLPTQLSEAYQALLNGELSEATSALLLKVVLPGIIALAVLIVLYLLAKLVSRWVSAFLCDRFDRTVGIFGGKLTFYTIMIFSGLAVLQTLGVGVTAFAAVLGAMGLAIGLAFQGTLSNFAAGVLLLVFRPFKVGDLVQTAGIIGKVHAVDLFTTTFDTPDNRRLIVPNSSIAGATIENISFHPERRVEVIVGVEYAASLEQTRTALMSCAEAISSLLVEGEGRGFSVLLGGLGPHSVDWKVRAWTAKENFFAMQEALTEEIKRRLDQNGIRIPFPQMQLHFADSSSSAAPAIADRSLVDAPSATSMARIARPMPAAPPAPETQKNGGNSGVASPTQNRFQHDPNTHIAPPSKVRPRSRSSHTDC